MKYSWTEIILVLIVAIGVGSWALSIEYSRHADPFNCEKNFPMRNGEYHQCVAARKLEQEQDENHKHHD